MGKTIAVSNLKGGVGKTATAASLGAGLARQGKRVLCLDADAQHSLTVSLGVKEPDKLPVTLSTMMSNIIIETDIDPATGSEIPPHIVGGHRSRRVRQVRK